VSSSGDALERRRQVLLMTVALQRFALRSDIGSLRTSLAPRGRWQAPAVLASAAVGASCLLPGEISVSEALRLLRLARFAGRCWTVALAAIRLVRP
jgi:hypothetical protein